MTATHAFEVLEARLSELRIRVAVADSMVIDASPNLRASAREAVAGIVVATAAAEEVFFRALVSTAERTINDSNVPVARLHPPLRAFLTGSCVSRPDRLGEDLRQVYQSLEVCAPTTAAATANVSLMRLLPSGRTIRAEAFRLVFRALGIGGAPFPSNASSVAVNRIADWRNWVAHGEETADSLRQYLLKSGTDLHRTLKDVEDACSWVALHVDHFCSTGAWASP